MGKPFDIELKNKIVSEYFDNQGGVKVLAKKYGISYHTIQNWVDKQIKPVSYTHLRAHET